MQVHAEPQSSTMECSEAHIYRYLLGMKDYDIAFAPDEPSSLLRYRDSDYGGCIESRKSTFGYRFKLGHGSISWWSKLQDSTTTCTTEAEYVVASDTAK